MIMKSGQRVRSPWRHAQWSAVLLVLVAAFLSACSSTVKLRGVIGFVPDGEHVLITAEPRTLGSFALSSKAPGWSQSMPGPADLVPSFVSFSNNGRFFVLFERTDSGAWIGRYSVWETSTGRRTSPYFDMVRDRREREPGFVAVSDDGRWLASCLEMDGLRIYDAPKKALVYSSAEFSTSLQFAPESMRLATDRRVLELGDGAWREIAHFPDAAAHTWVGERLAMLAPDGVRIWERPGTRMLPYPFAFEVYPGMAHPFNAALRAFGDKLVLWEHPSNARKVDALLQVVDLASGTTLVSRRGLGRINGVMIRENTLVALVERGWLAFVVDLDLANGRVLAERNLGRFGSGEYRVAPDRIYFTPGLLPKGKFVYLANEAEELEILRLVP
jgi:hypothetical protein